MSLYSHIDDHNDREEHQGGGGGYAIRSLSTITIAAEYPAELLIEHV